MNAKLQWGKRARRLCLLIAALAGFAGEASAKAAHELMTYGGAYDVTKGFEARKFGGANLDIYASESTYHFEVSSISREESAVFGAAGMTWRAASRLKASVAAGSSTNNQSVAPDVMASGKLTFEPGLKGGWEVSPSVIYRHYRSSDWETTVALEAVRYATLKSDRNGYYVMQARAAIAPNSDERAGYSVGASVTSVRASGLSIGLSVEGGRAQYETSPALPVRSDYYALRPSLGFRLTPDLEVFVRGEFAHTDFYDVKGAMVGLKFGF
jgi:hypothetical protein